MRQISTVKCEESYSTLVQKLYFELTAQVALQVQLFLTAEEKYYHPPKAGKGSRTSCEIWLLSPSLIHGQYSDSQLPSPHLLLFNQVSSVLSSAAGRGLH